MDAKDIRKAKELKNAVARFGGKVPSRGISSVRIVERPTYQTFNAQPTKGTDYFTPEEVERFKTEILARVRGENLITPEVAKELVKMMHALPEVDKLEVSKGIRNASSFIYKGTKYGVEEMMHGGSSNSTGITLETNSVLNGSQTLLNLFAGTNITLADDGSGKVTITAIGDGTGTVTTVSVVTNQGVSGVVANATTTPAITLSLGALTGVTSFNGLVITANTGAITTGSWAATAIPLSKGGTGADLSGVAKGGLITGTAANTVAITVVGTDGKVLTADSGAAGGVSWQTPTTGTVTAVSVATANGFAGNSSGGATPALTLSTTITGVLKGNGTAISAASASTDYAALAFKTIAVSGQSDVVADSPIDTLTLVGSGITITTDATTDTITFTAGGASLTVGTTVISSGTSTRILYNNGGVLGEYTLTGSGTVVAMQTAPTFATSITTPAVLATANDSGALGASGTAFSDLFLASGAVINFAANNSNITHSSGILTVGAGEFRITSANVGTNADSVPTLSSTSTLTNKRITPRVLSAAAYTTDTGSSINGDTQDMFIVTAQTGALKFNNPSGTPTDGQKLIISVASSTTSARALTWDTAYGATTVALPTTTAATTATLTIGFIWSTSKSLWQCVAVA